MDFTNKLAYFFAAQILSQKDKDRFNAFTHTLKIAKSLHELRNYNSLLAVFLALQNPRIVQVRIPSVSPHSPLSAHQWLEEGHVQESP